MDIEGYNQSNMMVLPGTQGGGDMKQQAGDRERVQGYFLYSRVRYHREYNGRGAGWYFMLTPRTAYGPFPDRDIANTILEGMLIRLANGEAEEDFQQQA